MWPDLLLAAKLSSDQDLERGLQVWLRNFATVFLMMELERKEGVGKVLGVCTNVSFKEMSKSAATSCQSGLTYHISIMVALIMKYRH